MTRVECDLLRCPRKREYTRDELLAQIEAKQIHGEMDWGSAVGRETR